MKTVKINIPCKNNSYAIKIGSGLIEKIADCFDFSEYTSIYIITDSNVGLLYLEKLTRAIKNTFSDKRIESYIFPAGEENKTLETVKEIYKDLIAKRIDRKSLIINLGGGVVTDLGGFVASSYQRGIKSLNIPTTIEGMVDASVGGKVGVNFENWKNYIGAFYQPKTIIMDINSLSSLSNRDLIAGFGEIIKHGLIKDKNYFNFVSLKKPEQFTQDELTEIIEKSCRIKAFVVEKDEQEANLRKILNFGHTAGHAFESLSLQSDKPLRHGEAISLGMIVTAKISELMGFISTQDFGLIEDRLFQTGLPVKFEQKISIEQVLNKMKGDKKTTSGKIKWVLLKNIGEAVFDCKVNNCEILTLAVKHVLKNYD